MDENTISRQYGMSRSQMKEEEDKVEAKQARSMLIARYE